MYSSEVPALPIQLTKNTETISSSQADGPITIQCKCSAMHKPFNLPVSLCSFPGDRRQRNAKRSDKQPTASCSAYRRRRCPKVSSRIRPPRPSTTATPLSALQRTSSRGRRGPSPRLRGRLRAPRAVGGYRPRPPKMAVAGADPRVVPALQQCLLCAPEGVNQSVLVNQSFQFKVIIVFFILPLAGEVAEEPSSEMLERPRFRMTIR